jgi:hypothetical protein
MEPHAASTKAQSKVEQLQSEFANATLREGIATHLTACKAVPKLSMAMLVCKVWVQNELAKKYYPLRPPIPQDLETYGCSVDGRVGLPVFLIHFS